MYFALYGDPVLLQVSNLSVVRGNETIRETFVSSPIVAATVGPGIDFENLDPPVVITLGLLELPENARVSVYL